MHMLNSQTSRSNIRILNPIFAGFFQVADVSTYPFHEMPKSYTLAY